jgi:hypothetical protein
MSISDSIRTHCATAQSLIAELRRVNPEDETFDQLGILDGHTIVAEFLDHGEFGVAIEHVLYMVHESNISFPAEELNALHALAEELGIRNNYQVQ